MKRQRSEQTEIMKNRKRSAGWHRLAPIGVVTAGVLAGLAVYFGHPLRAVRTRNLPVVPSLAAVLPAAAPPLAPTALYAGTQDVPVLMYHDVLEKPEVYFDVTPDQFREQMEALRSANAHVIPLAELYDHLRSGKQLPPHAVVITFDDGYAGQYENAYPVLKELRFPATFFVHTKAVGLNTSRAHMSWEQLKALDREGLISVECHTITHPDDLRKCSDSQLHAELWDSKKTLEEQLGRKIRFLAYPVGNADGRVAKVAHEAGYEMAMTMGRDYARGPADAFFVPRFLPKYLPEICRRLKTDDMQEPVDAAVLDTKPTAIENGEEEDGQVRLKWIRGGRLSGVRINGRRTVPTIVHAAGAECGLNGTFFSDARVNSAGAGIVGPIMSRLGPGFAPGLPGDRERIAGRPLILLAKDRIAFLPFQPHLALDPEGVDRLLPGATDCFIAGAWLVHKGTPLDHDALERFNLTNIFDFRPRAFFGVDSEGRTFLGASSTGNQSDRLAETLVKLGLRECVLLDSGFSTSLVKDGEVLVTGIRRKDMPARPVPHALVLYPVDAQSGKEVISAALTPPPAANDGAAGAAASGPGESMAQAAPSSRPIDPSPGTGGAPAATGAATMEQLQALFAGQNPIPDEGILGDPATAGRHRKRHRHRR